MGIEFACGGACWSYEGFDLFKNNLIGSLGYTGTLNTMYNDGTYKRLEKEPIYPLVDHSNYDENISIENMRRILPQLTCIVNRWKQDSHDKKHGLLLIAGMHEALKKNIEMEIL